MRVLFADSWRNINQNGVHLLIGGVSTRVDEPKDVYLGVRIKLADMTLAVERVRTSVLYSVHPDSNVAAGSGRGKRAQCVDGVWRDVAAR